MGEIRELTEAIQKLTAEVKMLKAMPVQREPSTRQEGKFNGKEGLKRKELSDYLGIGENLIKKYEELFPCVEIGNRIVYMKSAIKKKLTEKALENAEEISKMEVDGAIIRKLSS